MNAKAQTAGAAVSPSSSNEELVLLQQELDALRELLVQKDEAHRRALADSQNILKRSQEERRHVIQTATEGLLGDLLPTLDHLDMAVQHFPDNSLRMIASEFRRVLESHGLQRMAVMGQSFDPHTMEAVETGEGPANQVLQEQRTGYQVGNKVLRHAQVVVGNERVSP